MSTNHMYLRVWDLETTKLLSEIVAVEDEHPVVNSDDTLLIAQCTLYDTTTGRKLLPGKDFFLCPRVLQGSVAFSPDGTLLAVLLADKTVELWGVRE